MTRMARTTRWLRPLLLATALLAASCYITEETTRLPSPDGVLDAVVKRGNGGATTPFYYFIYLVAAGKPTEGQTPICSGSRIHGLYLEWCGPKCLEIRYDTGEIEDCARQWQPKETGLLGEKVAIRLVQNGTSPPANP